MLTAGAVRTCPDEKAIAIPKNIAIIQVIISKSNKYLAFLNNDFIITPINIINCPKYNIVPTIPCL